MAQVTVLASLDSYERGVVADALESVDFSDGEYIIKQGEDGREFFIVEQVSLSICNLPHFHLGRGQR